MSDQSDFNDELLNDKLETLLEEDNEIKKWNEGLLIKSIILLPIIIFIVGLIILNRPENITDLLFVFLYPVVLILIGLILLFFMRSKLKQKILIESFTLNFGFYVANKVVPL